MLSPPRQFRDLPLLYVWNSRCFHVWQPTHESFARAPRSSVHMCESHPWRNTEMRHLLRSFAAISCFAVAGSLAAHAAGITYAGTMTITDNTSHSTVSTNSFTFNDPPTG